MNEIELKNKNEKRGGAVRAIISLVLSLPSAVGAVFAVSLSVTVIQGLQQSDFGGALGAAFAIVFLFICSPISIAFGIPSIVLGSSGVKRMRRDKADGIPPRGGVFAVGISGLSLGALSTVAAVVAFAVALVFVLLR